MAVKTTFKPTKFADLFNQNEADYQTLDTLGVKVIVEKEHFSVVSPSGENIVGQIGLKQGIVGLAQQGNLPDIAKAPVAAAIKASYKHALKTKNWSHEVTADDVTDETLTVDDIDAEEAAESAYFKDIDIEFPKGTPADPVDTVKQAEAVAHKYGIDPGDVSVKSAPPYVDGKTLPKVALKDAQALYQPVKSTSESSTYFCVAMAGDLKFAARRQGDSLSIRVEGPVGKHKGTLVAAGFNEDYINKGYTSVHFHGIDDLMAQRALGAVLFGTGLKFETQMPDVAALGA